ncbi:MAG: hypothetical protein JWM78_2106 [Verrucomicrobiaceae bacterium]|nr:hypothetical protein [Verrucomicrobiaceae bacterium]
MGICALAPDEKKILTEKVGEALVKKSGKKKTYTVEEVKAAARGANIPFGWDCWAYSLYCDRTEFDAYHQAIGEVCNFDFMHGKMLEAVSEILPNIDASSVGTLTEVLGSSSWFSDLLDSFGDSVDVP